MVDEAAEAAVVLDGELALVDEAAEAVVVLDGELA